MERYASCQRRWICSGGFFAPVVVGILTKRGTNSAAVVQHFSFGCGQVFSFFVSAERGWTLRTQQTVFFQPFKLWRASSQCSSFYFKLQEGDGARSRVCCQGLWWGAFRSSRMRECPCAQTKPRRPIHMPLAGTGHTVCVACQRWLLLPADSSLLRTALMHCLQWICGCSGGRSWHRHAPMH